MGPASQQSHSQRSPGDRFSQLEETVQISLVGRPMPLKPFTAYTYTCNLKLLLLLFIIDNKGLLVVAYGYKML